MRELRDAVAKSISLYGPVKQLQRNQGAVFSSAEAQVHDTAGTLSQRADELNVVSRIKFVST